MLLEAEEVASEGERRMASVWKVVSSGVSGVGRSGRLAAEESSSSSERSRLSKMEGVESWRKVLQGAVLWQREREGRCMGRKSLSSMEGKPNSMASSNF